MVSNEEIEFKLRCKRERLSSKEVKDLLETEIPHEWVGNACVFNFGSVTIDDLSDYIESLFEWWGYSLEEGIPTDGIYGYGSALKFLLYGLLLFGGGLISGLTGMRYRFKVEIYSIEGKTYLKIFKGIKGILSGVYYGFTGMAVLDKEFHRIVDEIKYAHLSFEGYLVCDKCNEYYKLQPGESPYDFTNKCECGGNLKYYENID